MEEFISKIQEIVREHLTQMSQLSVYDQKSLIEKGKMLATLQEMEVDINEVHQVIKDGIIQQKQGLEKYMREAEESFNAVRQNIYAVEKPVLKKVEKEVAQPTLVVASPMFSPIKRNKKSTPNLSPIDKTNNWITVVRGGKKRAPRSPEQPKLVKHEVAPDVFIQAYTISSPELCHKFKGWWCYCPEIRRFCTSLNREIICGTTTVIRPITKTPKKFSEDRRSEVMDWEKSNYFIPRERNPESCDVREFTNKMKFVPASQTPKKYETYCYRLGSKDTLRDDIVSLKSEDYRLFADLTSNFLLCWTVAAQEMRRRESTGIN